MGLTPWLDDGDVRLYHGDCLEVLRELPDQSVHMVATSPPFYGLRDYGTGSWEGGDPDCDHGAGGTTALRDGRPATECSCGARRVDRQIGLEDTPDMWVARLVEVFRECRRVLRDDGTLWVEIGDSYTAGATGNGGYSDKSTLAGFTNPHTKGRQQNESGERRPLRPTTKPKDLLGQPWLLAQALRDPWYAGDIKAERDRVWLAATLDAEGCIAGNRHVRKDSGEVRTAIHISITNTSLALLDEASRIWPTCRQQHDSRDGSLGERPCWRWTATNVDKCSLLMRELYPHLIVKKRQAMLAYNFFEMSRQSKRLGGTKQGEEMRGRRDWIVAALSDLNRGRDVDVPSWIEEPPTLHERGWFLRSEIIWARLATEPDARERDGQTNQSPFDGVPPVEVASLLLRPGRDTGGVHWPRGVRQLRPKGSAER